MWKSVFTIRYWSTIKYIKGAVNISHFYNQSVSWLSLQWVLFPGIKNGITNFQVLHGASLLWILDLFWLVVHGLRLWQAPQKGSNFMSQRSKVDSMVLLLSFNLSRVLTILDDYFGELELLWTLLYCQKFQMINASKCLQLFSYNFGHHVECIVQYQMWYCKGKGENWMHKKRRIKS